MKRIIINASRDFELRVAHVEDDRLCDLNIESDNFEQKKANIYKGRITRVEPSLEAVFVDYGEQRQGFLPFKDINLKLYPLAEGDYKKLGEFLQPEQQLIVQVEKEERGNKGASLTTFISLAGQYFILTPVDTEGRVNGISRSVSSEERKNLKDILDTLEMPEDVRVIVRTSGVGREPQELQWNLDYLVKLWRLIQQSSDECQQTSKLLYREGDVIMRTVRDCLREDIEQMIIDDETVYTKIKETVEQIMPALTSRVIRYQEARSIFTHYEIEQQVETAYHKKVSLPSGGEIVIDLTEALIAIDINSGRSTQGKDIEETALKTNLEAAKEIARQIRLRDLGGLIVIDFIDMSSLINRKQIEQEFTELSSGDRAKVKVGRISRFGLLELSRQHIGSPLTNANVTKCDHCGGIHQVRSIDSVCQSVIGIIEEKSNAKGLSEVQLQLPVDHTTYMLNECRQDISKIESRHGVKVVVIANEQLQHPNYLIKTVGISDDQKNSSYHLKTLVKASSDNKNLRKKPKEKASVEGVPSESAKKTNWFLSLFGFGKTTQAKVTTEKKRVNFSNNNRRRYSNRNNNSNSTTPNSNNPNRNRPRQPNPRNKRR